MLVGSCRKVISNITTIISKAMISNCISVSIIICILYGNRPKWSIILLLLPSFMVQRNSYRNRALYKRDYINQHKIIYIHYSTCLQLFRKVST